MLELINLKDKYNLLVKKYNDLNNDYIKFKSKEIELQINK